MDPNHLLLQDPSYDPYGFAKVATRTASSLAGAADACPGLVQKFFQTIFQLAESSSGLDQINQDMSLCSHSVVTSRDQVNQTLAQNVQGQWAQAVSLVASAFNVLTCHEVACAWRQPSSPKTKCILPLQALP